MPKPEDIAHWKNHYSSLTDEQVIAAKHQWVEHSEMHIAAVQVLYERQQTAQANALEVSRQQHLESLSHSSRLHGKTQFVAWLAFLAAVVGILVPLWLAHSSAKSSPPSAPIAQQAPVASPSPSSRSAHQVTTLPSATQPAAPPKP